MLGALALSGCAADSGEVSDDAVLRVYISLPLSGPSARDGQDAADGAELALADADGEAGGLTVEALVLDDTEGAGASARWTPSRAAANAREATSDSTAIAYLGEFESGATRASLPITNEARMLQVSPASAASDLVSEFVDSDKPSKFQPGEDRTFGRVIPSDFAQGEAAAAWANELRWTRVGIRDDGSRFGEVLARGFETGAADAQFDLEQGRLGAFTYLAGSRELVEPIRGEPFDTSGGPARMASDAMLAPYASPSPTDPPLLATAAALDPSQLPPAASGGGGFVTAFEAEYGRAPGRYAAYGYESMALILDSIGRASDPADRSSVVTAFFETSDRQSILGAYSIDEVGNTTLSRMGGYEISNGRARPVAEIEIP